MNDKIKMGQLLEIHRQAWERVAEFCAVMQEKDKISTYCDSKTKYVLLLLALPDGVDENYLCRFSRSCNECVLKWNEAKKDCFDLNVGLKRKFLFCENWAVSKKIALEISELKYNCKCKEE